MATENLKKLATLLFDTQAGISDILKDGKIQVFEGINLGAVVAKDLGAGIRWKAIKGELKMKKKDRDELTAHIGSLSSKYQDKAVQLTNQFVKLASCIADTIELIQSL